MSVCMRCGGAKSFGSRGRGCDCPRPLKLEEVLVQSNMSRDSLKRAGRCVEDPERKKRRAEATCRPCYYLRMRVGGSMITSKRCRICGEDVSYASTATGETCVPCAKKHRLCRWCGADVELRERRKL